MIRDSAFEDPAASRECSLDSCQADSPVRQVANPGEYSLAGPYKSLPYGFLLDGAGAARSLLTCCSRGLFSRFIAEAPV